MSRKNDDEPIRILIFSIFGKHRSWALARMLAYIYKCIPGIDGIEYIGDLSAITCDEPIHILGLVCGSCGCPYGCMCPQEPAERYSWEKLPILNEALERYLNLNIPWDEIPEDALPW